MISERPRPIWARMTGFAPWPARYCSKFETDDLRKRVVPKSNQVATVFMERKIKRAWLNETAVEEFTLSSLFTTSGVNQFNSKVFESNSNYRLAVMEAVRISYIENDPRLTPEEAATNNKLYQMALKLIHKYEPGFPNKYREERSTRLKDVDTCEMCSGTFCSGELRPCCVTEDVKKDPTSTHCNGTGRVHFHCLQPIDKINVDERWFCAVCCDNYGWQKNMLLPADSSLAPFFGTIDRYLPPSSPTEGDQMYHVLYDDGDGEEYFEHELKHAMELYDKFKGPEHNTSIRSAIFANAQGPRTWHGGSDSSAVRSTKKSTNNTRPWSTAHPAVGARVCKYFQGIMADPEHETRPKNKPLEFEVKREEGADDDESIDNWANKSDSDAEDYKGERVTMNIAPPARPARGSRSGSEIKKRAVLSGNDALPSPVHTSKSSRTSPVLSKPAGAVTSGRSHPLSAANTATAAMFNTNRAPARRAAVLLHEAPDAQKSRLALYQEKQAAVKRKLEASSSSGSSTSSNSNAVSAGVSADEIVSDNPYVPPFVIKKRAKVEEAPDVPDVRTSGSRDRASTPNGAKDAVAVSSAVAPPTPPAPVLVPEEAPVLPASSCKVPENKEVVQFMDECIQIMNTHMATMQLARHRALHTNELMPLKFCHGLVEAMAGDIIQIVTHKLKPPEPAVEQPTPLP